MDTGKPQSRSIEVSFIMGKGRAMYPAHRAT
ncbi:hypothetical protein BPC006_I1370 [Burkholderia pseudomallei BPC006]|nr:hypothetical protein BPC006_I1370 [Burkholderia pseudomallei BPC006]